MRRWEKRVVSSAAVLLCAGASVLCLVLGGVFSSRQQTPVAGTPVESASPSTITVRPGESIQAAIDSAPEGAVIVLAAGHWRENLTLAKNLTISGQGPEQTVLQAKAANRPAIRIKSATDAAPTRPRIEGITVTGAFTKAFVVLAFLGARPYGCGVLVEGRAQATITNCTIAGNKDHGIRVQDSAVAAISGSLVSENGSPGILLCNSARSTITGCSVSRNGLYGIELLDSAQASIGGCTVSDNRSAGIYFWMSSAAIVENCTVSGNFHASGIEDLETLDWAAISQETGIDVSNSGETAIIHCIVSGNAKTGVMLWGDARATIANCTISDNQTGISAYDSKRVDIDQCGVTGNGTGISLSKASWATVSRSIVSRNWEDGIHMWDSSELEIGGSAIAENRFGGILLGQHALMDPAGTSFAGHVAGGENSISGPGKVEGDDSAGGAYPAELDFLTTAEGGELDRRATP
jgi:parallel beta-helix repeat protein